MYKELNIGEIVELLIRVKDYNKQNITMQEADAINDACNILNKTFPRTDTLSSITEDTLFHLQISTKTVADVLQDTDLETVCKYKSELASDLHRSVVRALQNWIKENENKLISAQAEKG